MTRVLVCGGRRFNDALTFGSWMGGIERQHKITTIIQGGATGADFMAKKFGEWRGYKVETFDADWKRYGKAAGPIRNQRMIDEGKPDLALCLPGGAGTLDMMKRLTIAGIPMLIVDRPVTASMQAKGSA